MNSKYFGIINTLKIIFVAFFMLLSLSVCTIANAATNELRNDFIDVFAEQYSEFEGVNLREKVKTVTIKTTNDVSNNAVAWVNASTSNISNGHDNTGTIAYLVNSADELDMYDLFICGNNSKVYLTYDVIVDMENTPRLNNNLFANYKNCVEINGLNNFDTSGLKDMSGMFLNCYKLTSLDLSGFDTHNVTFMTFLFGGCGKLTSLDIRSFNISNNTEMTGMFFACTKLNNIKLGSKFKFLDNASLPSISTSLNYTGRWIRSDKVYGPYTSDELMTNYNGTTMAGTWVWETNFTKGDLDSNGKIEIIDVRLLLQAFINSADLINYSEEQLFLMDMDENGRIDIIDVRLLLQEYVNQ